MNRRNFLRTAIIGLLAAPSLLRAKLPKPPAPKVEQFDLEDFFRAAYRQKLDRERMICVTNPTGPDTWVHREWEMVQGGGKWETIGDALNRADRSQFWHDVAPGCCEAHDRKRKVAKAVRKLWYIDPEDITKPDGTRMTQAEWDARSQ